MPDLILALVPIFGVAASTAARWWGRRNESTILIPEDVRERLGNAPTITLSPELVRELEGGESQELLADVEEGSSPVRELRSATETAKVKGSAWTRENVTFAAVLFFSFAGFVWSVVVLSIDSSSEAKYGATATIGWVFGYWFNPGLLRRKEPHRD